MAKHKAKSASKLDDIERLGQKVIGKLTPDLLIPKWRKFAEGKHPLTGFCYLVSEVVFHMAGGYGSNLRPCKVRHEPGADGDDIHYYLQDINTGKTYDFTAAQFKTPVPYENGERHRFKANLPSKRAQKLIDIVRAARPRTKAA
jgi:hypothetical protein